MSFFYEICIRYQVIKNLTSRPSLSIIILLYLNLSCKYMLIFLPLVVIGVFFEPYFIQFLKALLSVITIRKLYLNMIQQSIYY